MKTILVAYASKNGSTAEIAEAIADELRRHHVDAEPLEAATVRDVGSYDAVVLGSAVYMRRWRRSARRFLRRHRRALAEKPLWVFSSGPVGEQKDPAKSAEWAEPRRTIEAAERLGAREHVVFGGRVPQQPHNFVERAMLKSTPAELADLRNWDEIRAWARKVAVSVSDRDRAAAEAAAG